MRLLRRGVRAMVHVAFVLVLFVYCLPRASAAFAPATISLLPQGESTYVIQATLPEETTALELVMSYDQTALSNPRPVQGGLFQNALMAMNPNVPGTFRMAAVTTSPVKGSGVIMTLSFNGSLAGARSPGMTVKLANLHGVSLPAQVIISAPIPPTATTTGNQADAVQPGSANSPSSALPVIQSIPPGTGPVILTMPVEPSTAGTVSTPDQAKPEQRGDSEPVTDQRTAGGPAIIASREPAGQVSQAAGAKKIFMQKSALDLVKEYQGERTPAGLMDLLKGDNMIGFRQEPPAALSDGRTLITVHFIAPADLKGKPAVQLIDASLVKLDRDPDQTNTWIAGIMPVKGAVAAAIVVPLLDFNAVFPLTVAPQAQLMPKKPATEADFKQFLISRGSATQPKGDLNKDGKRDYLDDYIFTVNYMVNSAKKN